MWQGFLRVQKRHPQKHDKDEFLSWDYEQMCTHDKQCAADMCEYAYIQGDKKFEWFGVAIDEKLLKDVKCSLGLYSQAEKQNMNTLDLEDIF